MQRAASWGVLHPPPRRPRSSRRSARRRTTGGGGGGGGTGGRGELARGSGGGSIDDGGGGGSRRSAGLYAASDEGGGGGGLSLASALDALSAAAARTPGPLTVVVAGRSGVGKTATVSALLGALEKASREGGRRGSPKERDDPPDGAAAAGADGARRVDDANSRGLRPSSPLPPLPPLAAVRGGGADPPLLPPLPPSIAAGPEVGTPADGTRLVRPASAHSFFAVPEGGALPVVACDGGGGDGGWGGDGPAAPDAEVMAEASVPPSAAAAASAAAGATSVRRHHPADRPPPSPVSWGAHILSAAAQAVASPPSSSVSPSTTGCPSSLPRTAVGESHPGPPRTDGPDASSGALVAAPACPPFYWWDLPRMLLVRVWRAGRFFWRPSRPPPPLSLLSESSASPSSSSPRRRRWWPWGGRPDPSAATIHNTTLRGTPVRVFDTPGIPDNARRRRTLWKLSRALAVSADSRLHLLLYVVRLDDAAAGGAEAAAMREVTAALSPDIWSRTVVVATHAHSIPPAGLRYYEYVRGRRDAIWEGLVTCAAAAERGDGSIDHGGDRQVPYPWEGAGGGWGVSTDQVEGIEDPIDDVDRYLLMSAAAARAAEAASAPAGRRRGSTRASTGGNGGSGEGEEGGRRGSHHNLRASLRSLRSARSGASSTSSLFDAAASTGSLTAAALDPDAYARAHLPLPPEMALMEHGLIDDDDSDEGAAGGGGGGAAAPDGTPCVPELLATMATVLSRPVVPLLPAVVTTAVPAGQPLLPLRVPPPRRIDRGLRFVAGQLATVAILTTLSMALNARSRRRERRRSAARAAMLAGSTEDAESVDAGEGVRGGDLAAGDAATGGRAGSLALGDDGGADELRDDGVAATDGSSSSSSSSSSASASPSSPPPIEPSEADLLLEYVPKPGEEDQVQLGSGAPPPPGGDADEDDDEEGYGEDEEDEDGGVNVELPPDVLAGLAERVAPPPPSPGMGGAPPLEAPGGGSTDPSGAGADGDAAVGSKGGGRQADVGGGATGGPPRPYGPSAVPRAGAADGSVAAPSPPPPVTP